MPSCNGCGSHVSASWVRVMEPEAGAGVDGCVECVDYQGARPGW